SRSWSAASRSSRSANTTRMRSVFQDPEVGMRAARLQSCAFLRSSCTCATINIPYTKRPACRLSEHQAERTARGPKQSLIRSPGSALWVLQAEHLGLVIIRASGTEATRWWAKISLRLCDLALGVMHLSKLRFSMILLALGVVSARGIDFNRCHAACDITHLLADVVVSRTGPEGFLLGAHVERGLFLLPSSAGFALL